MNIKNIIYLSSLFVNVAFARDINLLMPQKYTDINEFAILSDYKAHMWNIRQKNKNHIFRFVLNPKYSDTVYHIIPSEILTACFGEGIYKNSGVITLDHIGKDIKNYTVSELNYLLLVNTINLYKHKLVKDKSDAIVEAKQLILAHFKDKNDKDRLDKSVSDIKFYFDNMNLADYLPQVFNPTIRVLDSVDTIDRVTNYKYTELQETGYKAKQKYCYRVLMIYNTNNRYAITGNILSKDEDAKKDILDKINNGEEINKPRGIINLRGVDTTFTIDTSYYSATMMFLYDSEKFRNLVYKLAYKQDGLGRTIRDVFNLMNSNVSLFAEDLDYDNIVCKDTAIKSIMQILHFYLFTKLLRQIRDRIETTCYSTYKPPNNTKINIVQFPAFLLKAIYQVLKIECENSKDEELIDLIRSLHAPISILFKTAVPSANEYYPMVVANAHEYDMKENRFKTINNKTLKIYDILANVRINGYRKNSDDILQATPSHINDEIIYHLNDAFKKGGNKIQYSNADDFNHYEATGVIRRVTLKSADYMYIRMPDKSQKTNGLEWKCDKAREISYEINEEESKKDELIRFSKKKF